MTNLQKYYNELMKSETMLPCYWHRIINRNLDCQGRSCDYCHKKFLEWLNEEYKEPIKLTEAERVILKNMSEDFRYIARDKNGYLYVYRNTEPDWSDIQQAWRPRHGNECIEFFEYNHLFQFVKWTDEKPYKIKELLSSNNDLLK